MHSPPPRTLLQFLQALPWPINLCALAALALSVCVAFMAGPADAQSTYCGDATHQPGLDPEVLVGLTPTRLPQLCGRGGFEIQNLGPNPIWCTTSGVSSHARINRARKVDANGGVWGINGKDTVAVWCVTSTAPQSAGGGTIVSEVR